MTPPASCSASEIEWQELLIGGCAIDAYGVPLRDEDAAACEAADAIFLGAVGGPKWDDPKVRPEQRVLGLRKRLDLFANIRPVSVEESLSTRPLSSPKCSAARTSSLSAS